MTTEPAHHRSVGLIAPKGGQGTTTVAAGLALLFAELEPTILIGGPDTAAALGVSVTADRQRVTDNLELITHTAPDAPPIDTEARLVLDGMMGSTTFMVIRPCYLALRRAAQYGVIPDGVIGVMEPGRALGSGDMERVINAPMLATVPVDPVIARALDAGLLACRIPEVLRAGLRPIVTHITLPHEPIIT